MTPENLLRPTTWLLLGRARCSGEQKPSQVIFNKRQLPFGIRDHQDARRVSDSLQADEKKLLFDAMRKSMADQYLEHKRLGQAVVHNDDCLALWYIYFVPHLVVGILHSVNLIFLGDAFQRLGATAGLSVMGAAGLANVCANVFLLNFSGHIESLMDRVGLKRPVLSAEQMHTDEFRYVTMGAKVMGMLLGSLIGLTPLLFYDFDSVDFKKKGTEKHAPFARSFHEETSFEYAETNSKRKDRMRQLSDESPSSV